MALLLVLLIVGICIIILIDRPRILEVNDKKRISIIYYTLISMGFIINFLLIIDKAPTSPAIIIKKIVKYVLEV
ncbi:hypothetical protein SAMN02745118_02173 [Selenihalanaerobacter shriftii]|uniref:Uncharacterized protein n=1 Tax=Selenihalanaerobacter shriftii TaxID=142842 RepID=A0A1T4PI49_9FIRM|nr:hypothetical protein SAMN02745118_02173 [Selenihalanaerobacter shriftii]